MHFRPRCVYKCITEFGRSGAYVPARVALRGRIRRSFPAHNACIFGMETSLRGRSGGHTGTAPTVSFGQIVRGRLMPFGQITYGWLVAFGWIVRRRLVSFLLKIVMKFMAKNFALIKNILIFGESKGVFSAA